MRKRKKSEGKKFEEDIKASFPKNCFAERYKDDTAGFKGVCNPADFRVYNYPFTFLIECKTIKGKSLPFAKVRMNQLKEMLKATNYHGVYGGYLINFRELEETYWVTGEDLYCFMITGERKSFPVLWVKETGIWIPQTKKRTRYRYDLSTILLEGVLK